jgi:hypothetical protein
MNKTHRIIVVIAIALMIFVISAFGSVVNSRDEANIKAESTKADKCAVAGGTAVYLQTGRFRGTEQLICLAPNVVVK